DGETGYLVKAGDVKGMAEAIIDLLESPKEAREMGMAGRKAVYPKFTAQTLIANVEGLYAELLRQKGVNFHER
ncbi:MAG: hypothetical protein KAT75_06675, partial [Dehalococcoidia bacterium]|nr:hypothetical protein [Dehalococcoidia bacterium]